MWRGATTSPERVFAGGRLLIEAGRTESPPGKWELPAPGGVDARSRGGGVLPEGPGLPRGADLAAAELFRLTGDEQWHEVFKASSAYAGYGEVAPDAHQYASTFVYARTGWTIDEAEDGKAALARLGEMLPDLILLDLMMPEMDGFETTRGIREHEKAKGTPRTPIIALTALSLNGARERCIEAGMDDYLSKPLEIKPLAATLGKWTKPNSGSAH